MWAILPFFDSEDPDPVIDAVDPTTDDNVDHQCPEPGLPYTQHRGEFGTCTMHPSNLHAEPIVALGAGDIVLPNHSHIIEGTTSTRSGGRRSPSASSIATSGPTSTAAARRTRAAGGRA